MKKGLYLLLITFMFLPLIQLLFPFASEVELGGEFTKVQKPEYSNTEWFNGNYQTKFELYLNDTIGFKKSLVRVYNQYCYSVFGKANSDKTIVGKDGYLFQENAINSFLGNDFAGNKKLDSLTVKFKEVQEDLAKRDILLIAAIAPNKASYFRYKLPNKFKLEDKKISNYEYLSQGLKQNNSNFIDFSEILRTSNPKHPIFPKNGMHWSGYSTTLTFKMLTKFIEEKTNKNLVDYSTSKGITIKDSLRYTDEDIAKAMNTIWMPENLEMNYPVVKFDKPTKYDPNILIIGDSYAQSYYGFYPFYEKTFNEKSCFWYYNRIELWPYKQGKETNVHNLDKKSEILERDIILLLITEDNAQQLGFGFLQEYEFIMGESESPRELALLKLEDKIRSDEKWFEFIKKQAIERKQTIEQTLRANAIFIYNKKNE